MRSQPTQRVWNRRQILAAGGALAGTLGLAGIAHTEDFVNELQDGDSSPFKLGIQSYSLRGLTEEGRPDRAKALAASKELGIHYWESYVAHVPMNAGPAIETIAKAIKDHHPKIGCCIDTGHFLLSKIDPVDAVLAFGTRVYGVHLKDVKNANKFTILGEGDLRTVDLLKALSRNKYSYCLAIEYEEKAENPVDDIRACLAEANRAIAVVRKG